MAEKFEKIQSSAETKAALETQKGWSPESNDFWNLGVTGKEAEEAEMSDKVSLERGLSDQNWDPIKFERGIKQYAEERGLDQRSAVAEASYLSALEAGDIEKVKNVLRGHFPFLENRLVEESRDLLKTNGDPKEIWKRLKLRERVGRLAASLERAEKKSRG